MDLIRILLLADTHLGFDLPSRPRIQRRRRGHDFFANFEKALEPARQGMVTCIVHGGDLLYRSKVPPGLVAMAFEPLHKLASNGIPVYLVPGNHERSEIPFSLLARAPGIHIFDRPRTFLLEREGLSLALSGFPYLNDNPRRNFLGNIHQSEWTQTRADCHLLCIHQCVEGAVVGPSDFMFRSGPDVIRAADIPSGFSAILSGHIHRAQVLTGDLKGNSLPAPVIYPGSIERTSFAEKNEKKGFFLVEISKADISRPKWVFHELPVRPMIEVDINPSDFAGLGIRRFLASTLGQLPPDSIVKLRFAEKVSATDAEHLRAASLRKLAPPSMNISVSFPFRDI